MIRSLNPFQGQYFHSSAIYEGPVHQGSTTSQCYSTGTKLLTPTFLGDTLKSHPNQDDIYCIHHGRTYCIFCYCNNSANLLLLLLAGSVLWMESSWVPKFILCVLKTPAQLILENLTTKLPSLNWLSPGDSCSQRPLPSAGSPSTLMSQDFSKQTFSGLSKQGTELDFICKREPRAPH